MRKRTSKACGNVPNPAPHTPPWSVIEGKKVRIAEAFYDILRFHVHGIPAPLILDATAGTRIMYTQLEGEVDKRLLDYEFIFGDLRHELIPKPHLRLDARQLPFRSGIFDVVVSDPPFMEDWGKIVDRREEAYGYDGWKKEDLYSLLVYCNSEYARVLKPQGKLILKIQNQWMHGRVYFHRENAIKLLWNFQLCDEIIYYKRLGRHYLHRARFKHRDHALIVHSHHLVFTKLPQPASSHCADIDDSLCLR